MADISPPLMPPRHATLSPPPYTIDAFDADAMLRFAIDAMLFRHRYATLRFADDCCY